MAGIWILIRGLIKFMPAFLALAKAIEAIEEEQKKQEFANDYAKSWEGGIETGDASKLHALIESHPAFKLR